MRLLEIPTDWRIHNNQLDGLDPFDDNIFDSNFQQNFFNEDLLWIQNGHYHIDLGWYGSEDFSLPTTGFMLVLYRGQNWNNCELLELTRLKSLSQILIVLKEILEFVSDDLYSDFDGYRIDDGSDNRYIGQHLHFSVRSQNLQ